MSKLIVAKSGFNATTEKNPDNLKFSSDYNTLKYAIGGHYQMNIGVLSGFTITTQTIPHNLGYVPFFIVYCNDIVAQPTYYGIVEYKNHFGSFHELEAHIDNTNLYLTSRLTSGSITIEWYYKIFKNNLGL
jgi:hypothetical protein